LTLAEICPEITKELANIENVKKYLAMEPGTFMNVEITTLCLEAHYLAVRNEEDDLNEIKKKFGE
jgi:hypothetical protein